MAHFYKRQDNNYLRSLGEIQCRAVSKQMTDALQWFIFGICRDFLLFLSFVKILLSAWTGTQYLPSLINNTARQSAQIFYHEYSYFIHNRREVWQPGRLKLNKTQSLRSISASDKIQFPYRFQWFSSFIPHGQILYRHRNGWSPDIRSVCGEKTLKHDGVAFNSSVKMSCLFKSVPFKL